MLPDPATSPYSWPDLSVLWAFSGYLDEGATWLRLALKGGEGDSADLARCHVGYCAIARVQGNYNVAIEQAGVAMRRRLGDESSAAVGLMLLAIAQLHHRDMPAARAAMQEAVDAAAGAGHGQYLAEALTGLADLSANDGDYSRAIELYDEALAVFDRAGSPLGPHRTVHNKACTLRQAGRPREAELLMRGQMPTLVPLASIDLRICVAEDYAATLADLDEPSWAAVLIGAADRARAGNGAPRHPTQEDEIAEPIARAKTALGHDRWSREHARGAQMSLEEALHTATTRQLA